MLKDALDLLEHARVLRNAHARKLFAAPVFVENEVGVLAQLLHVRANKHLAKLDEVAVVLVVNLNNTPGIRTSANRAAIRRVYLLIRADDSKRNLALRGRQ